MKSSITVLLSIGQQNDHFQEITYIRFQRSCTVQYHYMKNCGFSLKSIILLHQLFSVTWYHVDWWVWSNKEAVLCADEWKWTDFQGISCLISKEILLMENNNFSYQMLYRSVHLSEKWTKWTYFNEIKEIKELLHFSQFSKESLLPFVVLVWNITKMTEMNRFQWNYRNQGN